MGATSLEFVALDVETANNRWGSICSFGVAVVKRGQIAERHTWLSRPPAGIDHFDPFYTMVHGITAEMVAGAPTFAESVQRLSDIVGDRTVVAHSAAFDIGQVRRGCAHEGIEAPEWRYACSMMPSRRLVEGRSRWGYGLMDIAHTLGLWDFTHHEAGDDAATAAAIVIALAEANGAEDLPSLVEKANTQIAKVTTTAPGQSTWFAPSPDESADPDHQLYGRVIAFTGAMALTRREAQTQAAQRGAVPADGVTKKTNILVIGDGFRGTRPEEFDTNKARKAATYRAKGQDIEIMTERDFIALVSAA